jgi:hypothetical protein
LVIINIRSAWIPSLCIWIPTRYCPTWQWLNFYRTLFTSFKIFSQNSWSVIKFPSFHQIPINNTQNDNAKISDQYSINRQDNMELWNRTMRGEEQHHRYWSSFVVEWRARIVSAENPHGWNMSSRSITIWYTNVPTETYLLYLHRTIPVRLQFAGPQLRPRVCIADFLWTNPRSRRL